MRWKSSKRTNVKHAVLTGRHDESFGSHLLHSNWNVTEDLTFLSSSPAASDWLILPTAPSLKGFMCSNKSYFQHWRPRQFANSITKKASRLEKKTCQLCAIRGCLNSAGPLSLRSHRTKGCGSQFVRWNRQTMGLKYDLLNILCGATFSYVTPNNSKYDRATPSLQLRQVRPSMYTQPIFAGNKFLSNNNPARPTHYGNMHFNDT